MCDVNATTSYVHNIALAGAKHVCSTAIFLAVGLAMKVVGAVRKAGQSLGYTSLKDEQLNALCAFMRSRDVFVSFAYGL